jgi:hypothetical protein
MPLDTKDAMLSSGLNQPVTPPPPGMSNFQSISGVNPNITYGMPFTSGSTINNSGTTSVNTANPGEVRAEDFNQVGGNVAGLYGRNQSLEDTKAFIPEAPDPIAEETDEFIDAYEDGYTAETGIGKLLGSEAEAGTMKAARLARRDDRRADKKARRKAAREAKEDGYSKKEARQLKRQLRKGARATRKESWKTFKGERDLSRADDAYKLEQQYS